MKSSASSPQTFASSSQGVIRRGFGLKAEIMEELNADYHSEIVKTIRAAGHQWTVGRLHLHLAKEFGFCYGVDKAIDFAYETRYRFPDRDIYLTNEIIHNPRVNLRLQEMGLRFLAGQYADGARLEDIQHDDVVILPAFGVDTGLLERLRKIGCILVDTTCGSVVHVWKRVERYARDGFTSVIHGKYAHEETVATCSHITSHEDGHYLVLYDKGQAEQLCEFIRTGQGANALAAQFAKASSPGLNFSEHFRRIGVANQTTMLSSESLQIAEMIRLAMVDRYGPAYTEENFRTFDTICNATQERQDAVLDMVRELPLDVMLVVGGYNSSNTTHLAQIAARHVPTYHVDDPGCLISPREIRHKPPQVAAQPVVSGDWLPQVRPLRVGLTAGASTPNRVIGEVIERLVAWEEAKQD